MTYNDDNESMSIRKKYNSIDTYKRRISSRDLSKRMTEARENVMNSEDNKPPIPPYPVDNRTPQPLPLPLEPDSNMQIIRLTPIGSDKPLPDSIEDDSEEIFVIDEVENDTNLIEFNTESVRKYEFSLETQMAIDDILNDDFDQLVMDLKNNPNIILGEEDEISLESSQSDNTPTYNVKAETHRRAHLENYWCDFCADRLFMHDESGKKRIDQIIKKNRLLDVNNDIINTAFFSDRKSDAHELGIIMGLSPVCRHYISSEYNSVYMRYEKALVSNNMPSYEFVSKGIVYQYNKGHYAMKGIDINDIPSVRSNQLKNGLQCGECDMIACPFHRKYSNFDMRRDVCGWCSVPIQDFESLDSSDTMIELDRQNYAMILDIDDDSDDECDCPECTGF
jgi:hypothetical protein